MRYDCTRKMRLSVSWGTPDGDPPPGPCSVLGMLSSSGSGAHQPLAGRVVFLRYPAHGRFPRLTLVLPENFGGLVYQRQRFGLSEPFLLSVGLPFSSGFWRLPQLQYGLGRIGHFFARSHRTTVGSVGAERTAPTSCLRRVPVTHVTVDDVGFL